MLPTLLSPRRHRDTRPDRSYIYFQLYLQSHLSSSNTLSQPSYLRSKGKLITGNIFALVAFFRHSDRPDNPTAAPIAGHGMTQSQLDQTIGLVLGHAVLEFRIAQTVDEGGAGSADGPGHLDAGTAKGDVVWLGVLFCVVMEAKRIVGEWGIGCVGRRISKTDNMCCNNNKKT